MTRMSEQTLKATVQRDLTTAMRERDPVRAGTLRMALTAITTEEVSGKEARELTDDDVLRVIAKEAKKRKEASTAYADAGRPELASDEELAAIATRAVGQTGATGMGHMGQVMKAAQAEVAGRADGGRVAAAVKAALASL